MDVGRRNFLKALGIAIIGSAIPIPHQSDAASSQVSESRAIDDIISLLVDFQETKTVSARDEAIREANLMGIPLETLVVPERYDKAKAASVMQEFEDKGYVVHKVPGDGLVIGKIEEVKQEVDTNFGRNFPYRNIVFRSITGASSASCASASLTGTDQKNSLGNFWSYVSKTAYSDLTTIEKAADYLKNELVPKAQAKKEYERTFADRMFLRTNDFLLDKASRNGTDYRTECVKMFLIGGRHHEPEHRFTDSETLPYLAQFAHSFPFYDLGHISKSRPIPGFLELFGGEEKLLKMSEKEIRNMAKVLYSRR